jgi:hypothetical protein
MSHPITASELGTLWITYQQSTMTLRMLEYFMAKSEDETARSIMNRFHGQEKQSVETVKTLFRNEGAALPVGFVPEDVNPAAPRLYDHGFDILFLRLYTEIGMGIHTLNIGMAYREDIVNFYKDLTAANQECYNACTQYLLGRGFLSRSPYVTMPRSAEFVERTTYLGGITPFSPKRTLNTVELAHLYHAMESNTVGMQMILGFAQCARSDEVRKYMREGAELAKNFIGQLGDLLIQSNVQAPSVPGGTVTRSTAAPFSDKLMMYCVSLLCTFSIGGNSLGTAFSLRNDLPAKITVFLKDIFEYAHKGAKLMIRHGWMEEPPQVEERNELIGV